MYEFKAGDKGLTRNGEDYEVLLVDKRLSKPVIAMYAGDPDRLCQRLIDGRQVRDCDLPNDLLPPKRFRYINLFFGTFRTDHVFSATFDTVDEAVSHGQRMESIGHKMVDVARPVETPQ